LEFELEERREKEGLELEEGRGKERPR